MVLTQSIITHILNCSKNSHIEYEVFLSRIKGMFVLKHIVDAHLFLGILSSWVYFKNDPILGLIAFKFDPFGIWLSRE